MQDPPDAARLLDAIADTLERQVRDGADAVARHEVRVAANLCRILQREAVLGVATEAAARKRLASLLGHDGPSSELWRELAERLASPGDEDRGDESQVHAALLSIVRDKLAVAKPGYDAYDFAGE